VIQHIAFGMNESDAQLSLCQCILGDLAVLHDDDEVPCRIFQQLDVGDRVAVDEQQVAERAFFNDSELAQARIARAG
jgi:hypothetical protein